MARAGLTKRGNTLIAATPYAQDLLAQYDDGQIVATTLRGTDRSTAQNDLSHAWYAELARSLGDESDLKVKAFCKLHFGVPLLRSQDDDFREKYDATIKLSFTYEQKLIVMEWFPVTSLMSTKQFSAYLEAMQQYWLEQRHIVLRFPDDLRIAA